MNVKMTKAYGITTPMFLADSVNVEATMPFSPERRDALEMLIKFVKLY